MSRIQGAIVIALLGIIVALIGVPWIIPNTLPNPAWEYHIIVVPAVNETYDDMSSSQIPLSTPTLNQLGDAGWELVGVISEIETVFPNFGSREYVTGIQSNTRSKRSTLIFKRQGSVSEGALR